MEISYTFYIIPIAQTWVIIKKERDLLGQPLYVSEIHYFKKEARQYV